MPNAKPYSAHPAPGGSSAPHPTASERALIPPEGPPNLELRTGMKVSPTHRLFLDEASQPESSGAGPTPPVGPPNIKLRPGMKLPETHRLFLDEAFPHDSSGPTPPEGPPNIKVRTGSFRIL